MFETIPNEDFSLLSGSFEQIPYGNKTLNAYVSSPSDKPKLVFLHGKNLSQSVMMPFLNALSAYFCVLAPDLPGHGLSSPPDSYTCDEQQNAVTFLIKHYNFDNFYLIGHSMGGLLAIYMLQHESCKELNIKGVISIAPRGIKYVNTPKPIEITHNYDDFASKSIQEFEHMVQKYPADVNENYVFLFSRQVNQNTKQYYETQYGQSVGIPLENAQKVFENANTSCRNGKKITIILAEQDSVADSAKINEFLRERCQNITVKWIDGGHDVVLAAPVRAATAVQEAVRQMGM